MPSFTPGPWLIAKTPPIQNIDGIAIVNSSDKNPPYIARVTRWYAESEANARLIAAAPEMLEALKLALQTLLELGLPENLAGIVNVKNAVAKAEGK